MGLSELNCDPCPPDGAALVIEEQQELLKELSAGWQVIDGPQRLFLAINTKDFKESLEKAQLIGKMADEQWHHPELVVAFKVLKVEIFTHVIKGLRKADFIFAAKVDQLLGLAPRC